MKKYLLTLTATLLSMTAVADGYDLDKPFGFCTVSSRTDASSTFNITGGGVYTYPIPDGFTGKATTLKSNGQDMKGDIQNAIKQYDVVILDGAYGEFIVSSNIGITASNKTIIGINNAIISTKWYVTDEIKKALNDAGVPNMSTSGGGGKLPNGQSVSEEAEYNTRKIIIEMTKDNNEDYRKSGCISLSSCQNIIIRNITFKGPGAIRSRDPVLSTWVVTTSSPALVPRTAGWTTASSWMVWMVTLTSRMLPTSTPSAGVSSVIPTVPTCTRTPTLSAVATVKQQAS